MSQASDTDVRLFLQLANPSVAAAPPVSNSIYEEEDDDDEEAPDLVDEDGRQYEDEDEDEDERREQENGLAGGGDDATGNEHPPFEDDDDDDGALGGGYEDDDDPPQSLEEEHKTGQALAAPIEMDAATLEVEKQSALLEIERLRAQGVKITKEYSLDDDLTVIQWEIRKQLMLMDEANSVSFMKDAMRLGFSGIEAMNGKIKLLELEGWAAVASSEMAGHKYDNALSKIYRKYWRRGSSSPEMEIAFGILGSMGSYHFKKKMMTARPPSSARPRTGGPILDDSDDEEPPR